MSSAAGARTENGRRALDFLMSPMGDIRTDLMTDDVRWWIPRSGAEKLGREMPLVGRDVVESMLSTAFSRYAGRVNSPIAVIEQADQVAILTEVEATTAGGHTFGNTYCYVFRFDGTLIDEIWELTDTAHLFAQVGLAAQA